MNKTKVILLLLLLTLAVYSRSLNGEFLLDDYPLILANEDLKHLARIPFLFVSNSFKYTIAAFEETYACYRPLPALSFAVNYFFFGYNTFGYHLTNCILHAVNAFLVFLLIRLLFHDAVVALLAGVLFAVHPIHAASVAFISGRADLLLGLFTLLSLVSYVRYSAGGRFRYLVLSLASFICALISREALFMAAFLLFVYWANRRGGKRVSSLWLHCASFAGILAIYALLRSTVLVPIGFSPRGQSSFFAEGLNFLGILRDYLGTLLIPYPLYMLKTIPAVGQLWSFAGAAGALFLLSAAAVLFIAARARVYPVVFGLCWFFIGSLHVVFFMHKFTGRISAEEHWFYLASIGIFLIAAYLLRGIARPAYRNAVFLAVVLVYGSVTAHHAARWRSEIEFYRYTMSLCDAQANLSMHHFSLAAALARHGRHAEALAQARFIVQANPRDWLGHVALGDILFQMDRVPEARSAWQEALKGDPLCWQAAQRLRQTGEEDAVGGIDPAASAEEEAIISLLRRGDFQEALFACEKLLAQAPTARTYTLVAVVSGKVGDLDLAQRSLEEALKLDPRYLPALHNLMVICERKRDFRRVGEIAQEIRRIRSSDGKTDH